MPASIGYPRLAHAPWIGFRGSGRRNGLRVCAGAKPRRIKRWNAGRVERRQINGPGGAVEDQLRDRFAGRRRIEDTPDAMPGGHVNVLETRDRPDQRQPVPCDQRKRRTNPAVHGRASGAGASMFCLCPQIGGISSVAWHTFWPTGRRCIPIGLRTSCFAVRPVARGSCAIWRSSSGSGSTGRTGGSRAACRPPISRR